MSAAEMRREVESLVRRHPKKGIDPTISDEARQQLVERERMKGLEEGEKYHSTRKLAKGGKIDGCAQRGKTRGRMV